MSEQNNDINAQNGETLVDNLIESMDLGDTTEDEMMELRLSLREQLDELVMDALANHLEPEVMTMVAKRYEHEGNTDFVLMELISESPAVQIAVAEGVAELRQHLTEASKQLNEV